MHGDRPSALRRGRRIRQQHRQVDRHAIFSAERRAHWLHRWARPVRVVPLDLAEPGPLRTRRLLASQPCCCVAITYQGRVRPGGADGDAGFSRNGRPRSRRGDSSSADGLSVARDRSDPSSRSRGGSPEPSGEC